MSRPHPRDADGTETAPQPAPEPPAPPPPGLPERLDGVVSDLSAIVVGTLVGTLQSLTKAARHVVERRVGQALQDVALVPANAAALTAVKTASALQGLLFVQDPPRRLREEEMALLEPIYGSALELRTIRVVEGGSGILNPGRANIAITIGNTIHFARGCTMTPSLLAHEATHVWQYQNGGNDYLLKALWAQLLGEGYDVVKPLARGDAFPRFNPEQQARLVENLVDSGYFGPSRALPPRVSQAQAEEALEWLRSGRGAGD